MLGCASDKRVAQVKVLCGIEKHSSPQMDFVSRGVTEPKLPLLLFKEGIPAHVHSAESRPRWYECECAITYMSECVGSFTYALGTSCSAESQGKLCCGTASELLKQWSADKPCILSPRERARA